MAAISFSGFNNIDFGSIVTAIMAQESQPLTTLTTRQTALTTESSGYRTLATKLSTLDSAAAALSDSTTVTKYSATSNDTAALSVSAGSDAIPGQYEVVVSKLARAQVTASATTAADANTTAVATGGTLTIGGKQVQISGSVTLQGLATAINGTSGITVKASVIQTAPGAYRLALTSTSTGAANAFTISNGLTGGAGIGFTDTNNDGISGDTTGPGGDNAVDAGDASVLINNIPVASTTNTLSGAIPGVTLTLNKEDAAKTIAVTVASNNDDLTARVQSFITAYNDLMTFAKGQRTQAAAGAAGTLARDPVLLGVKAQLRNALTKQYSSGGAFTKLAEVGVGFDSSGNLTLNKSIFSAAVSAHGADVAALFAGTSSNGAFAAVQTVLGGYTDAGGFLPSAQTQKTAELSRLSKQITDMQARLAIRRTALQREFTAADEAMTRLNSQAGALASFGVSMSTSSLSSS
jgi:flagellar hook-associated protein 2